MTPPPSAPMMVQGCPGRIADALPPARQLCRRRDVRRRRPMQRWSHPTLPGPCERPRAPLCSPPVPKRAPSDGRERSSGTFSILYEAVPTVALWGPGKPEMQRMCEFFDTFEHVVEVGSSGAAGGSTGRSCIALTGTEKPGNVLSVGLGKSEFLLGADGRTCWWVGDVHHQRGVRPWLPLRIGGSPSRG
jgi:hypothetical protein